MHTGAQAIPFNTSIEITLLFLTLEGNDQRRSFATRENFMTVILINFYYIL